MDLKLGKNASLGVAVLSVFLIVTGCTLGNSGTITAIPVETLEVVTPGSVPELTPETTGGADVQRQPSIESIDAEAALTLVGVDKYFPPITNEISVTKSGQMTNAQINLIDRAARVVANLRYQSVGAPVSEQEIMNALSTAGIQAVAVNLENISSPVDAPNDAVIVQFYNGQLESITVNDN
jgi:hypothetical protein